MTTRQKSFYLAHNRRYERYMRALADLGWWPMRARSGGIARNYLVSAAEGPELLTNGDFSAWTGDNPDGWIVSGEAGGDEITERDSGQLHADTKTTGGSANMFEPTGNSILLVQSSVMTVGRSYRMRVVVSANASAVHTWVGDGAGSAELFIGAGQTGTFIVDFIAAGTSFNINHAPGAADVTFDLVSLKEIGDGDARITGTTSLGQTGWRGVGEAFLLDGATSILTVPNQAAIQGLTAFSLWMLFNPSNAGELNAGVLFSKASEFELRFNSVSRDVIATVNYSTSNGTATTSTALAANAWHTVGMRIDNTGKAPEIFVDGVEASYAAGPTAGVGTRVSNTNNLIIGNNVGVTGTLAGRVDEAALFGRALTDAEWLQLHLLAGLN